MTKDQYSLLHNPNDADKRINKREHIQHNHIYKPQNHVSSYHIICWVYKKKKAELRREDRKLLPLTFFTNERCDRFNSCHEISRMKQTGPTLKQSDCGLPHCCLLLYHSVFPFHPDISRWTSRLLADHCTSFKTIFIHLYNQKKKMKKLKCSKIPS